MLPPNGYAFQVRPEERAAQLIQSYHVVGSQGHGIRNHYGTKAFA